MFNGKDPIPDYKENVFLERVSDMLKVIPD